MLTVERLSVEYRSRGQRTAVLRDFNLQITRGETVGLVGPSGCGKSTVALSILRLIRPAEGAITNGAIRWQGAPDAPPVDLLKLPEPEMRRVRGGQIAMVFQDPFSSLNPVLSIQEQMAECLTYAEGGEDGRQRTEDGGERTEERGPVLRLPFSVFGLPSSVLRLLTSSLDEVQLDPMQTLGRYPHQLSGGQRQRVMIAMALLRRPSLLIADEPTTALDVLVQREVMGLLKGLQGKHGMAMLLISHSTRLVKKYTDRMETLVR